MCLRYYCRHAWEVLTSAEVCCLNPAEREREEGGKREGEAEKPDNGESKEESGGKRCF